jgi:hypothetical protein
MVRLEENMAKRAGYVLAGSVVLLLCVIVGAFALRGCM